VVCQRVGVEREFLITLNPLMILVRIFPQSGMTPGQYHWIADQLQTLFAVTASIKFISESLF